MVGDLGVDALSVPVGTGQTMVVVAGQTERINNTATINSLGPIVAASEKVAAATSVTMGWTGDLEGYDLAYVAYALKGATGGGGGGGSGVPAGIFGRMGGGFGGFTG